MGIDGQGGFLPNWGKHPILDPRDQEFASEWSAKSKAYYRRSRDVRMEKGGSPPPKFHEDNLFTDECSRKKAKSVYRLKGESDCWDVHHEEKDSGSNVEDYTNGRLGTAQKEKRLDTDEMTQRETSSKEVDGEDSSSLVMG